MLLSRFSPSRPLGFPFSDDLSGARLGIGHHAFTGMAPNALTGISPNALTGAPLNAALTGAPLNAALTGAGDARVDDRHWRRCAVAPTLALVLALVLALTSSFVLMVGAGTTKVALAGEAVAASGVSGSSSGASSGSAPASAGTAVGNYLTGRFAEHVNDWDTAVGSFAVALERDPDQKDLTGRAFSLQLARGDYDAALALAGRMADDAEETPLAELLLLADALRREYPELAAHRLAGLPEAGLMVIVRPIVAAWVAVAGGRAQAAVASLAPLRGVKALVFLHALQAGTLAEIAGDQAAARRWLLEVAGGDQSLRSGLAGAGFLDRQEGRAGPLTATPAAARRGMAEAMFDLASVLARDGDSQLGLTFSRLALFVDPGFALAHLLMGDLLNERGRHDEAVQHYRTVAGDAALGWTARLRIGDTLVDAKNTEGAIAHLEAMAAERPERVEAVGRLGDLLRGEKRLEAAVAAYDRAIERLGNRTDEQRWLLLYGRAVALDQAGRWAEAERDLEAGLTVAPDQPTLLNYLGYSWANRNSNLDRARRMIERAVQARPKDGYIVDSLGWVLLRQGDVSAAVRHLEKAVELKPLDPTINDHLGDAYWAAGRRIEAVFQWRRSLRNAEEGEPGLRDGVTRKLREHAAGTPIPD